MLQLPNLKPAAHAVRVFCRIAVLVVGACGLTDNVLAQIGTGTVSLDNYDSNNPLYIWDVSTATTKLAPVAGTFVQILGRLAGSTREFQILTHYGGGVPLTIPMSEPGFFAFENLSIGAVPGVPERTNAEITIRAWNGAASWEAALRTPSAFVGQSPIFENRTGTNPPGPGAPNPEPLNAPSFTMYPVPELCGRGVPIWPPLLCLPLKTDQGDLLLRWTDVGTNYVYTLEASRSLTITNWSPVAGGPWPSRTNQWVVPASPEASRYYRVRAGKQP